jgi:DNA-binding beta-propeller fold protein YncE
MSLISQPHTVGSETRSVGSGIGVDESTGDVYVTDTGNHRVDEFSSTGTFIRAWGWGVTTGATELQVCTSACRSGISGDNPGEFETPVYVAVDDDPLSPSFEDVYVGDAGDDLVTKFDPAGHLISSWGNNGENGAHEHVEPNGQLNGETSPARLPFNIEDPRDSPLEGVTVNSAGELWVYTAKEVLFEFTEAGLFQGACETHAAAGPAPRGIAARLGAIYLVDGAGRTKKVLESDCLSEAVTPSQITNGTEPAVGVAVDSQVGDVFVDASGEFVEDLAVDCVTSPKPVVCSASETLGEGVIQNGAGVAVNGRTGVVYVADAALQRVLIFDAVVEASSGSAAEVTAHGATLIGTVNPLGTELARCEFEYGETTAYGTTVSCIESPSEIGAGSSPVAVRAPVVGLGGGKEYHFRLRAKSAVGEARSSDASFGTVQTATISGLGSKAAAEATVFEATVDPEGVAGTEYTFQYGPCSSLAACPSSPYPESLPTGQLPPDVTGHLVSGESGALSRGVTYHFRLLVSDAHGVTEPTPEGTFTTEVAAPVCSAIRPQEGSDALPDCRSYEMVSPVAKNGALINDGIFASPSIARSGSVLFAKSIQCFGEATSCTDEFGLGFEVAGAA